MKEIDCLVLGAGPAGLSAALWLRHLKTDFQVLEPRGCLGGELPRINLPVSNFLGRQAGSGRALLDELKAEQRISQLPIRFGVTVEQLDLAARCARTTAGEIGFRTLLVATGLRRRRLDLPDADRFLGRGLTYSATTDRAQIAGKTVLVLGGGDGAMENALILAEQCPRVFLAHNGPRLTGRREFVDRLHETRAIRVLPATEVVGLEGKNHLQRLHLRSTGKERPLAVDWLVVKIGFQPNTELVREPDGGAQSSRIASQEQTPPGIDLDEHGYVVVDRYLHTSCPGVFAAGDVCNSRSPCIAAAVGDGAVAAREVGFYLETPVGMR